MGVICTDTLFKKMWVFITQMGTLTGYKKRFLFPVGITIAFIDAKRTGSLLNLEV